MKTLVIVCGNGGAGKKTSGQLLYAALPNASWTHMRWMAALKAWEPTPQFDDLILRNAAGVISNYLEEGTETAILSGGVFTQEHLDRLIELLPHTVRVCYFWLEVSDETRLERVIARNRDSGDSPEVAAELMSKFSHKAEPLHIPQGLYQKIDAASLNPKQVVDEILKVL